MNQKVFDNVDSIDQETSVLVFPASFAQQRLYFLQKLAPHKPFYNVSTALRLKGLLNVTALQQTINEIVRRHEILRTTFILEEGQLVQLIAPSLTIPLPVIDLRHLPSREKEKEAQRRAIQEAKVIFDLATGPLLRSDLLQLDDQEYVLLLNLHHIITDGWSIGVFIRELGTLYSYFKSDPSRVSPLPDSSFLLPLPIQYADFAEWQREWLQGDTLENQLYYWQHQLKDLSLLNLPTDRARSPVPTYNGACQSLVLNKTLTQALEKLSQTQGVTLFMTLLAAFQTLLYRYTQQEDIAIGSAIANRNRSEIEGVIGFFVNSLVLRTNFGGNPTFLQLLERVKKVTLEAYAHQDAPFEKLVEKSASLRDLSLHPLFQISFTLQNTPIETLELPDLGLSLLDFDMGTAKLDLEFHIWQEGEILKGKLIYSTDLFDESTITRMLGHFVTLLKAISQNPEKPIGGLPILTNAECKLLLIDWNNTHKKGSKELFHHLFEAQVEENPNTTAVVWENQHLTYSQLNAQANQLAYHLQSLGVTPEVTVALCLEPCLDMIVAFLAILKAGGVYLPLDPAYPSDRLKFLLDDAQVSVLLTHQKLIERLPNFNRSLAKPQNSLCHPERSEGSHQIHYGKNDFRKRSNNVVCLDQDKNVIAQYSNHNPTSNLKLHNLAYIIYTSGSTGKPKGVLIEHRGLSNLIAAQIETFNPQPSDRILQFASLSFDASIFEIVMALSTGASLYLVKKDGESLMDFLRNKNITHATLPPAVLRVLPLEPLPALKTVIAAGEACSAEIVRHWGKNRQFFNAYGLTEATVWSTVAKISNNISRPPIGRPILNTQVYILDNHLQPVPIGIPGELYISGEGLARGYLNRPELTLERFIPNPFSGERLYKTGDLARYLTDGNIEFLGRLDEQVKMRGLRIELGEIEALLRQHRAVKEAVVVPQPKGGDRHLVAYIVPQLEGVMTKELQNFLKKKLPNYMVPSIYVFLDSLPLTPNGKVDRAALKTPITDIPRASVAPRNGTETAIAKIWGRLLNLETISIDDNFFEVGGNSLQAIQLINEIKKDFSSDLSLSALFLNPTIADIANYLTNTQSWSPLVAIQSAGSKPPFFCVHPIFGVVFPYYELASCLGKDQPFYALQPVGMDGKKSPFTHIEDMAAYYIEALRKVQPTGPYFLGGWSFGGLVAFEMAQQLMRANEKVALLALLDTEAPIAANKPSFWQSFLFMLTKLAPHFLPFLLSSIKHTQIKDLALTPMLRIYYANSQAVLKYLPQAYLGSLALFKSSQPPLTASGDSTMGWSHLATERIEIYAIPGNHLTMVTKPNVQTLAFKLSQAIDLASKKI